MEALKRITRDAVLTSIKQFDELGREPFLRKYGYRKASTYFLVRSGREYDAKAIIGAAYGFLAGRSHPLEWHEFGSRDATTRRRLVELGFNVIDKREAVGRSYPSEELKVGRIYTRTQLKEQFSIEDATINNGVFPFSARRSVWLFVTKDKPKDRTQYKDELRGNVLEWQGQTLGRTDHHIIEHRRRRVELLLFYRLHTRQYAGGAFRYEGRFRYVRNWGTRPTSFLLQRQSRLGLYNEVQRAAEKEGDFDARNETDARRRTLRNIVRRQGRPAFRAALLSAYGGRCAVTGCDWESTLEAAHIRPYKGDHTDHVKNGILLRADIHTLFDLHEISINPRTCRLEMKPSLLESSYSALAGRRVKMPRSPTDRPHDHVLQEHYNQFTATDKGRRPFQQTRTSKPPIR